MRIESLKIPSKIIKRSTYLDKVASYVGQNIIKVLTGQRRVGKSYLLFQIIHWIREQNNEASILYINKEDLAFSFIESASHLSDYVLENASKSNKTYVFIDEIQDIENFGDALRSLLLHQNLDIYCTGSNANLLSSDIAGHLSGRYINIEVFSLWLGGLPPKKLRPTLIPADPCGPVKLTPVCIHDDPSHVQTLPFDCK